MAFFKKLLEEKKKKKQEESETQSQSRTGTVSTVDKKSTNVNIAEKKHDVVTSRQEELRRKLEEKQNSTIIYYVNRTKNLSGYYI